MKLGFICQSNANAYYRAIFPMHEMERRGHTVVWPQEDEDMPVRSLVGCDLVHSYRRVDRLSDLHELAQYGVAISFDNDDNYAAVEAFHGRSEFEGRKLGNRQARLTIAAARFADLATTTSVPLAEHYRAAGAENVTVIDNRLTAAVPGFGSSSKHDGVVLGWVAESEHRIELERLPIAAVLRTLLDTHPDLRLISVGLRLPIQSDRYEHIAEVPLLELLRTTRKFDIGIAPLADTAFNRSRSDIKLKEYASGCAAWLASPVGPYRGLGEAQGGLLVADDEWVAKAGELIRNPRRRRRLARRASKWARDQVIERHGHVWEEAFAETIERVAVSGRVVRSGAARAQA